MISFNQIPTNIRVPFVYIEFDSSRAQQGPSVMPYTVLILGQKLSTGTQPELELVTVSSEAQARTLFGAGSMLHAMVAKFLENNKVTEVKAMAIDDAVAGVQATGKLTFSGTATADGTVALYIAGRRILAAVDSADDQDAVAAAVVAAITADPLCPVIAAVNGVNADEVDLTARHKGLVGNGLDVRFNYYEDDAFPAGIGGVVTTPMASGTTNPDIAEIIAALPEDQFIIIAHPWSDTANLTALEAELADRFGPLRQNDGVAITCAIDSLGNLQSLGNGRNSPHSSIFGPAQSAPNPGYDWAAAIAAQVALSGQADPGRPFQTLPLTGILAPTEAERFIWSERNTLLYDGIATCKVDTAGAVRIERAITTYQTNQAGAPDTAYLDVNTLLTLSYIRYDFRNMMLTKYPRHKLGNDGQRYAPGQPVMTPKLGRSEAIARFAMWQEDLALVEGLEQFKRDLIVERNSQDPNRLDFLMPPDLINQLRVVGAQIQFLL